MFTWALSVSGVQILTLEVLSLLRIMETSGQQWQEAEITAIREGLNLTRKVQAQAKLPTILDRSPAGRWRVHFPSVSNTETTVTVLCDIDTVVVNVDAGWIITPSVNMGTAFPTKLPQVCAMSVKHAYTMVVTICHIQHGGAVPRYVPWLIKLSRTRALTTTMTCRVSYRIFVRGGKQSPQ